jgi:hypothetical protein
MMALPPPPPPQPPPPLQSLDLRNIQVISQVLAQSVAMDFYSRWVLRVVLRVVLHNGGLWDQPRTSHPTHPSTRVRPFKSPMPTDPLARPSRLPVCPRHLLPAACCLLPAACCLLPAACCLLPGAATWSARWKPFAT